MPRQLPPLPAPVRQACRKLGGDIRDARRRRRLTAAIVADRARIDPATLWRVERGVPSVSLGIYATVLFVLGMGNRITDLADADADAVGRLLDEEHLPRRVRLAKPKPNRGSP
jgi:transcriptional regulator with XRE-family HTH domain